MKTASAKSRLPEQQECERSWRFCGTWREVRHALTSKVADSPGLPVLAWKQRAHLVRLDGSSGGHVASSRTLRWGEVKSWRRRGSVKTWIVLPLRVFQLCAYIRAFWSFIRCLCVWRGRVGSPPHGLSLIWRSSYLFWKLGFEREESGFFIWSSCHLSFVCDQEWLVPDLVE